MISRKCFVLPIRATALAFVATAALMLLPQGSAVLAGSYTPCQLPVVVGSTVRPNVMIVQDMSGSMQFTAYYAGVEDAASSWGGYYNSSRVYSSFGCSPLSGLTAYQMAPGYYGSADTDVYYKYNATGNSTGGYFEIVPGTAAPAERFQFTEPSTQGSTTSEITFTAAGHNLVVDDYVAFYDLTSHTGMNGDSYKVLSVSGASFTVEAEWNGTGDTTAGQVVKRVIAGTSFLTGVNGTVLNWLLTTRTDAALKAFIGGRALTSDDDYYYLQYQGMRRFVVDEYLGIYAYIRPGHVLNPDYYASGTYYGTVDPTLSTSDGYKDMYMTAADVYMGTLISTNTKAKKNKTSSPAQLWTFSVPSSATVTLRAFAASNTTAAAPSWTPYINVYLVTTSSSGVTTYTWQYSDAGGTASTTADACANLTKPLTAGTYAVEVCSNSNSLPTTVTPKYYLAVHYEEDTSAHTRGTDPNITLTASTATANHNGEHLANKVGTVLNAQCRIQQPKADRAGVVQNSFTAVRFGFTFYKDSSVTTYLGKILVGCDNTSLDTFVNAMSGIGSQIVNSTTVDFTTCYPYGGTPTGPGLQGAYNYFAQAKTYTNLATNTAFYPQKETITDPYYGPDMSSAGVPAPVICRKSYVLLVSDGEWTSTTTDPVKPAYLMHTTDLRDLDNPTTTTTSGTVEQPQTVTTYAIFAFSSAETGKNAMKATAMYGAFTDVTGCSDSWPYPMTTYPSATNGVTSSLLKNSSGTVLPWWDWMKKCDPTTPSPTGHSYDPTCCAEWDSVMQRTGEETDSNKGLPDTFFEASDGQQLETSLKAVLTQVVSRDASASAVATVSQQLSTGDTVVRGVFEASDPDNPSKYLWYGHLEAYWPFIYPTGSSTTMYDFDLTCNSGLRCEEMPDSTCGYSKSHCWDGGKILMKRDLTTDPRTVFTGSYDSSTKKWSNLTFDTANITFSMLGVSSSTDAVNLVNWTLGTAVSGLRLRGESLTTPQRRLGDIVYSTPVVGGPPSVGAVSSNDPNISEFYAYRNQTWATTVGCQSRTCVKSGLNEILYRDKVVYVGANDGMVHAFLMAKWDAVEKKWLDQPTGSATDTTRAHADIGREIWAYIPTNILKQLSALASTNYGTTGASGCVHRPMVDLSDQVFEVYIQPPGTSAGTQREWRSVLIGGERGGGDTYFALDVTDPYDPVLLWEYSVIKDRAVYLYYSSKWYQPFSAAYDSMCNFPMSWTQPALGRLQLPNVKYYVGSPDSTGTVTGVADYDTFGTTTTDDLKRRHVAFVGGGIHLFDASFSTSPDPPSPYTSTEWAAFKADLFKPSLIVLDIETGHNLFKYIWPSLVATGGPTVFPAIVQNSTYTIPYAMSDPVAIDIWDTTNNGVGDDGFTDRVYMGDITGRFYGVKFTSPSATTKGIQVDIWKTKTISDSTEVASNYLRDTREPISHSPSISFEAPVVGTIPYLRVIFAAGKYEDIIGAADDKTDLHKTSLYNLKDAATMPTLTSAATSVLGTVFNVGVTEKCTSALFLTGCTWVKADGSADCCESSSSPCFKCVYDLTNPASGPAERFTAKPLIAGGYVFATSFIPSSDPCTFTGTGKLYIFSYLCEELTEDIEIVGADASVTQTPLTATSGTTTKTTGVVVALGSGMPSKPVLDSSGKNVIVQMSDGTLLRVPVTLATKPVQVQGWQEK